MTHTPEPWTTDYGSITGPTTPAIGGVTVSECLENMRWDEADAGDDSDPPCRHAVIRVGDRTIAIAVWSGDGGEAEGLANAVRIVACVNAMQGVPDPPALAASHARLLAACKDVVQLAFRDPNRKRPHHTDDYAISYALVESIQAAIAQAVPA